MMANLPTQAELVSAFLYLLPRGPVWDKHPGSPYALLAEAITTSTATFCQALQQVQAELFPATTNELLPEWEASTALPDACLGADPTQAQRIQQLLARLINQGGQSQGFYIAYAAALGYEISITTWQGAIAGTAKAGSARPAPRDVIYNWTVTVQGTYSEVLECELKKLNAAHMKLWFIYQNQS